MNDKGLKWSDGSSQSVATGSSILREELRSWSVLPVPVAISMSCTAGLSGVGECTRAARLVRSRELRLALGKNDVDGEAGHVRRAIAEDRRGCVS
jgi:hypothetical protein